MTILRSYGQLYRGLSPEVRCFLWLSAFVEFTYIGIYLVGFNLYLLRLGYGPGFAGVATGSAITVFSLTTLGAGYAFHGRSFRGLIVHGGVLFVAGLIGIAITDLVPAVARTPWVLVTNAVAWMGGALYSVGRPPYLVAALPEPRRVELFALERVLGIGLGALGSLAVGVVPEIVAALLGTSLDDPAPYRITLLLAPVGLGVALVRFAAAPRPALTAEHVDEEAVARARPRGAASPMTIIVLVSLCTLLLNMAFAPPQYLFNVYLEQGLAAPAPLIALVMSAARLASIPATVFLPALGARWSIGRLLLAIAIATGLALVPIGLFADVVVASLGFLVIALLLGLFEPAFDVFRMEAVPDDWRTRMAGISLAAMYGGQSAGGFAGGLIADTLGYRAMFIAAAALAAIAACLFVTTLQTMRPKAVVDARGLDPGPPPTAGEWH